MPRCITVILVVCPSDNMLGNYPGVSRCSQGWGSQCLEPAHSMHVWRRGVEDRGGVTVGRKEVGGDRDAARKDKMGSLLSKTTTLIQGSKSSLPLSTTKVEATVQVLGAPAMHCPCSGQRSSIKATSLPCFNPPWISTRMRIKFALPVMTDKAWCDLIPTTCPLSLPPPLFAQPYWSFCATKSPSSVPPQDLCMCCSICFPNQRSPS